jgi:CHAT domain-containing protein
LRIAREAGAGRGRLTAVVACSAGNRGLAAPDHALAISSAFLLQAAGVIAPLFLAHDTTTAAVMARFYRHWLGDGQDEPQGDPAAALRQAQVAFLQEARTDRGAGRSRTADGMPLGPPDLAAGAAAATAHDATNPYYWAGLTLSGA